MKLSLFIKMWVLMLVTTTLTFAQTQQISGRVVEATSKETIPFALFKTLDGKPIGHTDIDGIFNITFSDTIKTLSLTSVGFESKEINIESFVSGTDIEMVDATTELAEVKIFKKRYRNRENPAVDLIREIIAHKDKNRNESFNNLTFKEHEKVRIGILNKPEKLQKHPVVRLFPSLKSNFDTTRVEGKFFLPLYVQDLINEYQRANSKQVKVVLEEKKVKFDENIFDNEGIKMYINHMYQPFDIYDNGLMFVTNQFISPISDFGPAFYMYDILDTTTVNDSKWVRMLFTPRNDTDFMFWGEMKVSLENYAITEISMKTGKGINLNWVRNLNVYQTFKKNIDNKYLLDKSKVEIEFALLAKAKESYLTEKITRYYDYNTPEVLAKQELKNRNNPALKNLNEAIGEESPYDDRIYQALDSMSTSKKFKLISNLYSLGAYGYFNVNKNLEIGPLSTFLGYNQLEGYRTRIGLRTLPAFSNKYFLEGYGAYGFRDQRWKYYGAFTYSFTGKNKYVFPMKNITFSYRNDMEIPGNDYRYQADYNFILSFPRGENQKWIYYRKFIARYVQEFENRLSYQLSYEHLVEEPAGTLAYIRENDGGNVKYLTRSEVKGELRFAPYERFYQGKTNRSSLTTQYPVFTLRGTAAFKDFLGGDYNYQKLSLNIYKRFLLSPFGFTDGNIEMGATLGKNLPFPVLDIMRGNQTYTFQQYSYNMMNFMEFVADRFVSVKLEHNFNGAILNKIPLLSKLKFREYVGIKALYGGLSDANKPNGGNNVFNFPTDSQGTTSMFGLASKPYIEGSVGLGNVLKFFRIDLVKRFTYTDNPTVSNLGLRFRFDVDF